MMENDIDKIFKQGLENSVEPIFTSDWQAFEKSLKSAPFYKSAWFLSMLTLVIIATMGLAIFTFQKGEFPMYSARKSQLNKSQGIPTSEFRTDKTVDLQTGEMISSEEEELIENADADNTLMNFNSPGDKLARKASKTEIFGNDVGGQKNIQSEHISKLNSNTVNSFEQDNQLAENNRAQKAANVKSERRDLNEEGLSYEKELNGEADDHFATGVVAENVNKPNTNRTLSSSARNLSTDMGIETQVITEVENDLMPIISQQKMTFIYPLEAAVTRDTLNYKIIEDPRIMNQPVLRSIDYSVFFGVEQNAILKTSPSFGIVVRKYLSKWSVEAGIAYQQSGKLAWAQQSDSVSYGFERYENSIVLITNKIEFISLPLKLSYRVGGQSQVFAGFTPSILVNARQEKQVYNDGFLMSDASENGYLYDSGAPELIYFISAGYTYSLSEQFQFDFGLNYSFQKWNTSQNKPLGGFVKFYYTFR